MSVHAFEIAKLEREGCGGGSRDFLSIANLQRDSGKPPPTQLLYSKNSSKNSSKIMWPELHEMRRVCLLV